MEQLAKHQYLPHVQVLTMSALRGLSNQLLRYTNVATVLLSVVAFAGLAVLTFGMLGTIAQSTKLPLLDTRLYYAPADVQQLFHEMGRKGRADYQAFLFLDFGTPLIFGLMWALLTGYMLKGSKWRILNLMPLLYFVFDILENAVVLVLLHSYPAIDPMLVKFACIFTQLKYFGTLLMAVSLFVGLGRIVSKLLKRSQKQKRK